MGYKMSCFGRILYLSLFNLLLYVLRIDSMLFKAAHTKKAKRFNYDSINDLHLCHGSGI